jgi:drug/metabolite transporter (DMT)-like permease
LDYWIIAALGASLLFGITNNLDSHLVAKRMPGVRAFLLVVAVAIFVVIQPFIFMFPFPKDVGGAVMASALASALMRSLASLIMIFAFRSEEVIGVVPLTYAYPMFVALAAVPLLGETLNAWQWLAIIIIAAGAVIVALRPRDGGSGRWLGKNFPLLVLGALLYAGADLSGKYALEEISSPTLYWMSMGMLAVICVAISLRPVVIKSLKNLENAWSAYVLLGVNEIMVLGATILSFWAIQKGPVSLASTVLASRPVFVFMAAVVLSRLFPGFVYWQSDRKLLIYKFIAILLIVCGIAIIYLV